jgi:hypothetical protein
MAFKVIISSVTAILDGERNRQTERPRGFQDLPFFPSKNSSNDRVKDAGFRQVFGLAGVSIMGFLTTVASRPCRQC